MANDRIHELLESFANEIRIEEINREMGTSTKELALPIRKLIAAKAIKSVGAKRSTKYFAGGKKAKNSLDSRRRR